jgi:hypothetical protein
MRLAAKAADLRDADAGAARDEPKRVHDTLELERLDERHDVAQ